MSLEGIFSGFAISSSGLKAERLRMQTVAENLANINTTRQNGKKTPYQRKEIVFEEVLAAEDSPGGVQVTEIKRDESEPKSIYDPTHPDADEKGFVKKPNIDMHFEMVDLMTASRSYQANLAALKVYKDTLQRTINLGR